jgi:transposase-like protein
MKIINQISGKLTRCAAAVALAGLMSLPTFAFAQEKGATKLLQLKSITTRADADAVQPGDSVVMSCPKCKDSWVTVVAKPTKTGAKPDSITTARHECPGCDHKFVTKLYMSARNAAVRMRSVA